MTAQPTANPQPDGQARRTAVEGLYRQYHLALRRFIARRFSRSDPADIVQETYCRLQQLPDLDKIEHPGAFLFRVAGNLARNAEKRRRLLAPGEPSEAGSTLPPEPVAADPSAYRHLQGAQELALVRGAFRELSPRCRQVFVMNRFENMSYAQIARGLDVSVSMIEKYISQALAHMKASVDRAAQPPTARHRMKQHHD